MENLDPNQLPMLPDPTEEPALPAGPTAAPAASSPTPIKPQWFKTKLFRAGLISVGAIAVVLVVLFSQQIGQLLNLFGTKASTEESVTLNSTTFFSNGYTTNPTDSFRIDTATNRLMLNPPAQ
jgi:hypothetical protein